MTQDVLLATALRLPHDEWEALTQGRTIAAIPWNFVSLGQSFALCSDEYLETGNTKARFWAKCELCQSVDCPDPLDIVSKLTVWTEQVLASKLAERSFFFLAYLRVYELPEPVDVLRASKGDFLPLKVPVRTQHSLPVLSDRIFAQRKRQLENLEAPEHPEIEALHDAIAQLAIRNSTANILKQQITEFLGWSEPKPLETFDLAWASTINELATRSKEPDDDKKSNYQAGTDFEIVVRQGLAYLGFKVEAEYNGGAGGLDLFCSEPYPLVGECKSGRSITDRAVEELDRIGKRHLKDDYLKATRLIIGPGAPTKNLKESALISKTSILSAMTFQRLVELQAKYPGSVNLIELKNHLQPGQSDEAIEQYISTVLESIRVRSHVVQIVKDCLDKVKKESTEISALHTAYAWSDPPCSLEMEELYAILLELASPLTGYLGRIKGSDWNRDRFYFLRPLMLDAES